jgi:cyclopropane-fatty-acyl-phospholipid synthase
MKVAIKLAERGWVPEFILRKGIRKLLGDRLEELQAQFGEDPERELNEWIEHMRQAPVACVPEKANEQHYEVPPEYFLKVLGKNLKYSCCLYPEGLQGGLDAAEAEMLKLTCERAKLQDGQRILELGCGWGSLSLWMAKNYPNSNILSVSNSGP